MMRKKDRQKKNMTAICAILLIVCLVIAFAIMAALYFRKFDRTLTQENKMHLAETAEQINAHTRTIIEDTKTSLVAAAEAVPAIGEQDKVDIYLRHIQEHMGLSYIGFAAPDGILHTTYTDKTEDISDQAYFKAALAGDTQISGLQRKILYDKAVSGIVLATPLYDAAGQVVGVLTAMLDVKNLQSAMNVSSYNDNGYAYMIDGTGELVLRSKSMDYNNFFMLLNNVTFEKSYSFERVKADIKQSKPGITLYDNLGTEQYAYYMPLGINDWTIVNIVAKEAVTANTAALTRDLAFLCIISIAVFAILLTVLAVTYVVSENQRHNADMKSIFLANMSHELRTPMNAVVGVSELLKRENLTPKQQNYVQMIASSSKGLLTIINDILDFSKIESGKYSLTEENYNLKSLITEITTMTVIRIGEKNIDFYVEPDKNLPARLSGDAARIKQILVNLLNNAVKFTETGYIYLKLDWQSRGGRTDLIMRVTDTGIGIRRQDISRLFTSFNQVDTHHSHNLEGTGLGLAISRQLARLMGGDITVESAYGAGSTFTATVQQQPAGEEKLYSGDFLNGSRIALCEPSDQLRIFYEHTLNQFGAVYDICSDPDIFQALTQQHEYRYVSASRDILDKLPESNTGSIPAVLFHQQEYLSYAETAGHLAIYAPLLYFGLSDLGNTGDLCPASPAEYFDITAVNTYPDSRILIVDDNELNLDIAEALLSIYETRIDKAHSGAEALEAVKNIHYNLVFMDHMMPGMDGIETLEHIRSLPGEQYQSLPVVALTANATKEAQAIFTQKGFNGFLPKPIDVRLLDDLLKKHLGTG